MDHDETVQTIMSLVTDKGITVGQIGNYQIKLMDGLYLVMLLGQNTRGARFLQGQFVPNSDFELEVKYLRRAGVGLVSTDILRFCGGKGGFRMDDFPDEEFTMYGVYNPERSIETPAHWVKQAPRRRPNVIHVEPSERLVRAIPWRSSR